MKRKQILRVLSVVLVLVLAMSLAACGNNKTSSGTENQALIDGQAGKDVSNEEYVLINNMTTLPFFVNHDNKALESAGKSLGVKTSVVGPADNNIQAMIDAFEQTIARRPAGIMVIGWDESALIPMINKAIDAGIPTITVDADVPKSKRLAYIGTNWYQLGLRLGNAVVKVTDGKGKVAMLGLIGQANMDQAYKGFREVIAKNPGMQIVTLEDDKGDEAEAARITSAILQKYPDLAVCAGFDSGAAGIGTGIKEAGKAGQVKLVMNNIEPQQLQLIQDGVAQYAVGQKRELFTYYGLKLLYDMNHSPIKFSSDDKKAGVTPIPDNIDTGFIEVNKQNIGYFLAK